MKQYPVGSLMLYKSEFNGGALYIITGYTSTKIAIRVLSSSQLNSWEYIDTFPYGFIIRNSVCISEGTTA